MSEQFHTVDVNLGADGGSHKGKDRSYPIAIGKGLLTDRRLWAEVIGSRGVVLVTDDQVGPLYAERLLSALPALDRLTHITLPAGEQHKSMASVQQILDAALADRHERQSLFVALGGGVVGDVAGYAAATYRRGVPLIQIPTTLLSQVDSSVGGKTAINHPAGKNMIGAFHQPKAVLIDLDSLKTLPDREFAAGVAEIIKYGCIWEPDFYHWLLKNSDALLTRNSEVLAEAIHRSCGIKAAVVAQDEREGGLRAILNFGHTFAHAIEHVMGYGVWLHGEAVACGMVMAAKISAARGQVSEDMVTGLINFLEAFGLPVEPPPAMSAEPRATTWLWLKDNLESKRSSRSSPPLQSASQGGIDRCPY